APCVRIGVTTVGAAEATRWAVPCSAALSVTRTRIVAIRHKQPVVHPLLKMSDHRALGARDRDGQGLARRCSELDNIGAVTLRPHDPVLARHRHFFVESPGTVRGFLSLSIATEACGLWDCSEGQLGQPFSRSASAVRIALCCNTVSIAKGYSPVSLCLALFD